MASFIAKQVVGKKLDSVKGKQTDFCQMQRLIGTVLFVALGFVFFFMLHGSLGTGVFTLILSIV